MTDNFKEKELLKQLLDRDPTVIREFVEGHYNQLKKSLYFSEVSSDEYDDLIQDTFSTFFVTLPNFQKKSKISTFLWGIYYNKLREARRKFKKTPKPIAEIYEKIDEGDQFDEKGHWLSTTQVQDPENWENYSELSSIIQNCLEKLPYLHKQVILLQVNSDMEKSEICHSLDINDTNYRQCLSRGRKSLRSCVDGEFSEESNA